MKILAVSDKEEITLQNIILNRKQSFKDLDFVISCGDLSKNYLEFLADGLKKELFFVEGNHPTKDKDECPSCFEKVVATIYEQEEYFNLGGINVHARVETYKDYIIAGFEGSMRYNPGKFQSTQKEMAKIVKSVYRKIRIRQLKDLILGRKKKKIIIISHAPIAGIHDKQDLCHQGFECFKTFLHKLKPLIWFHGHIHFEGQVEQQITKIEDTLVVNAYGFHVVNITDDNIEVISNLKNL